MSSLFKDCNEDCNGGQGSISINGGEYQVESVRLYPFLSEHYSSSFIKNICMVKIDTEVCKLCSTGSPQICNTRNLRRKGIRLKKMVIKIQTFDLLFESSN